MRFTSVVLFCALLVYPACPADTKGDTWHRFMENTQKFLNEMRSKKVEPMKALNMMGHMVAMETQRLKAQVLGPEEHAKEKAVVKAKKDKEESNVKVVRKSGHVVALVGQLPSKPDIIMVCTGLNAKLASFVARRKVKPLSTAIRSLVSRTYHRLSSRSAQIIRKHGLHLSEKDSKVVLQQAITAAGMSEVVLRNASGHLGEKMALSAGQLAADPLTTLQRMTITSGFSSWLVRKHQELQRMALDVLKRTQLEVSPPEVQESLLRVLSEVPLAPSPPGDDEAARFAAAFVAQVEAQRHLSESRRARLAEMALQRVRDFARRAKGDVRHLLRRHNVHLPPNALRQLLQQSRRHLPSAVHEVQQHMQHEAAKVVERLSASAKPALDERRVEGYIREVARLVNILVHRMVTHNVSALFTRHNVTADCNALTEIVHEALMERLGVLPGVAAELRMRVRMAVPYSLALGRYRVFHREMRREVARVAEVLPSEVEIISLTKDGAVQFRIVAHGFDPEHARHLLHRSVVRGRFRIRIGGHHLRAVAPHHRHHRHHHLPWPLLATGATIVALLLVGLVTAVALALRRRRRRRREAEAAAEARPCVNSPYAKLQEPSSVYA